MAETAWKSPSTNVSMEGQLPGGTAWTNPEYMYASDDSRATVTMSQPAKGSAFSERQIYAGYGFDTDDIPEGSTITGIVVECEAMCVGATAADPWIYIEVQLPGDVISTADRFYLDDTDAYYPGVSAPQGLWDLEPTDADIRDADFGTVVQAFVGTGPYTLEVDHIRMKVEFTPPGNKNSRTSALHFQKHYEPTGIN